MWGTPTSVSSFPVHGGSSARTGLPVRLPPRSFPVHGGSSSLAQALGRVVYVHSPYTGVVRTGKVSLSTASGSFPVHGGGSPVATVRPVGWVRSFPAHGGGSMFINPDNTLPAFVPRTWGWFGDRSDQVGFPNVHSPHMGVIRRGRLPPREPACPFPSYGGGSCLAFDVPVARFPSFGGGSFNLIVGPLRAQGKGKGETSHPLPRLAPSGHPGEGEEGGHPPGGEPLCRGP